MSARILEASGVVKRFGGLTAVDGVDFHIDQGEIVSLIGPNGSGKTTFFHLLSGFHQPDEGAIRLRLADSAWLPLAGLKPHEVRRHGLARTFQTREIFPEMTVLDSVLAGMHPTLRAGFLPSILGLAGFRREEKAAHDKAVAVLGIFPGRFGRERWGQHARSLSFANRCRLEIAMCLAADPRILLIDEPAAGMTDEETYRTGELLLSLAGRHSLIVIEHDMTFVRQIARQGQVTVLHQGSVLCEGRFEEVQSDPKVREVYLGRGKHDRG